MSSKASVLLRWTSFIFNNDSVVLALDVHSKSIRPALLRLVLLKLNRRLLRRLVNGIHFFRQLNHWLYSLTSWPADSRYVYMLIP